jgi:RNA polymerase sigma-70 factor (ECF subfamily)
MGSGDELALASLYDRHELMVRACVLRILDRPMDAEDVVEEVFWQAWRQAGRFNSSRGTVISWLRSIARSRSLDRLRQQTRKGEVDLEDDDSASVIAPGGAEGALLDAERAAIVRRALDELPAEQRRALELAYYEGLSQSEIAEKTATPLGTVKTRMRLAHQKLRESLSQLRGEAT